MAVACPKWIFTLPNTVIRGRSGSPPTSKMELFVTIIYSWKHSTTFAKSSILDDSRKVDFTVPVGAVSVMKSFWIRLDGFFCQTKIYFTKPGPLPRSKMEFFVTINDSWKLLFPVSSNLDPPPPWLSCNFQENWRGLLKS